MCRRRQRLQRRGPSPNCTGFLPGERFSGPPRTSFYFAVLRRRYKIYSFELKYKRTVIISDLLLTSPIPKNAASQAAGRMAIHNPLPSVICRSRDPADGIGGSSRVVRPNNPL